MLMLPSLDPVAASLAENRRLLDGLVNSLSDAEMNRPPREGEYSGRQVIAHLAGADRGMTRLVQDMAADKSPRPSPDYDNDYYNARQQQKRAGRSVQELCAELDESHRELLALMETLKPEDLEKQGEHPIAGQATLFEVLEILAAHERGHIDDLQGWAEQMKK